MCWVLHRWRHHIRRHKGSGGLADPPPAPFRRCRRSYRGQPGEGMPSQLWKRPPVSSTEVRGRNVVVRKGQAQQICCPFHFLSRRLIAGLSSTNHHQDICPQVQNLLSHCGLVCQSEIHLFLFIFGRRWDTIVNKVIQMLTNCSQRATHVYRRGSRSSRGGSYIPRAQYSCHGDGGNSRLSQRKPVQPG